MDEKEQEKSSVQGAPAKDATVKSLPVAKATKEDKAKLLAKTVKLIDELHKKIMHRDRLEIYTQQLADFEIKKAEEDLETVYNYSGCQISITDDNRNEFKLKNPAVIKEVIAFMKGRFELKLAEIEAQIKLPA